MTLSDVKRRLQDKPNWRRRFEAGNSKASCGLSGLFVLWSNCSFLCSPPNQPASSQIELKVPRFLDEYQLASSALLSDSDNWSDSCLALARKYPQWKEQYTNELQTVASSEHAKGLKRLLQVMNDGIGKDERLLSGALAFTKYFCWLGKLALELARLDVC
ncbi:MAG: hypothetical protein IPL25_20430 [Saprospiraceae bacterium]|nr:hypothetical protein [Candidatus Vicinibacter affinis]